MPTRDYEERADLHALLRILRRRALLIAFCLIVCCGVVLGASLAQTKRYSASSSLLFRDPGFDQKLFGTDTFIASSSDPTREAATNLRLVSLQTVAERTARVIGGMTTNDVSSRVVAAPEGESDLIKITATDASPAFAARLANAFAQQYISFRQLADRQKIEQAERLVQAQISQLSPTERNGPRNRTLADRSEQLKILASLQTGNAELVQPAEVPSAPSSPKTARNAVLGALLGAIVGLGLAFLIERLDRRLRDPEALEAAFRLPVIAAVPRSRSLAGDKSGRQRLDGPSAEAFAMLRARLRYFNVDREIRSIAVTSAEPRDGKSTVAWYLTAAAAARGTSAAIIVEADLRRPTIAKQHGISPGPGLAELLTHDLSLRDVIRRVAPSGQAQGDFAAEFDVILAGATPPNPAELLESEKMVALIDELSSLYDFVVIDTPPMTVVSDAIPLALNVNGLLVVGRLGKTTRPSAARLHDQLTGLRAPTLGVVANDLNLRQQSHYYGYQYGSGEYGSATNGAYAGDAPPAHDRSNRAV